MTERLPRTHATVLVVEDDFLVRTCAVDGLDEHGFEVLQAADGPAAMQVLEASPHVDVLFTDINMPGDFDGLGLALRVRERWPDITIVITSGRGCPQSDLIPARFVAKPYMPETIVRILNELIDRQGGHRSPARLPLAV